MDWKWAELATQSSDASMVPRLLTELLSGSTAARKAARGDLYCKVANQGDLYSAAAAVVDIVLVELTRRSSLPEEAWALLEEIFVGTSYGDTVSVNGATMEIALYCRARIIDELPVIEKSLGKATLEQYRRIVFLLGAVAEHCEDVVGILRREVAKSSDRRKVLAEANLAEALEFWPDSDSDGEKSRSTAI